MARSTECPTVCPMVAPMVHIPWYVAVQGVCHGIHEVDRMVGVMGLSMGRRMGCPIGTLLCFPWVCPWLPYDHSGHHGKCHDVMACVTVSHGDYHGVMVYTVA